MESLGSVEKRPLEHLRGGKNASNTNVRIVGFDTPTLGLDFGVESDLEPNSRNGTAAASISENQGAYSKKLPKPTLINVVDFFCGCGGMSWGFANTRQSHFAYRVLGGVDIDKIALAT